MARTKLDIADQWLLWSATAPLGEMEAQYRRVGALLAQRRKVAPKVGRGLKRQPSMPDPVLQLATVAE